MRPEPGGAVAFVVLAAAFAGAGCGGCAGDDAPVGPPMAAKPPAPSPTVPVSPERVELVSTRGTVERRAPGGAWRAVAPGDSLRPDESIRTVGTATALLRLGETARIEVGPGSEFSVPELTRSLARVDLSEGRVVAVVNGKPGAALRVKVKGNDAVAEATRGEFAVLTTGQGTMAVAATAGQVTLRARAGTVVVRPGEQTSVAPDAAPAPPSAIPSSLYLKVGRPASLLQREKETRIGGRATPGAVVNVNGVTVAAGPDGAFQARVPLEEGENLLTVRAVDVAGRTRSVTLPPIMVKDGMGAVKTKVRWAGEDPDP